MSDPDAGRSHIARAIEQAGGSADLGLPIPPGTRLRTPKRLLARMSRLFTHRQVAYNLSVLDAVTELHADVESLRRVVVDTAKAHELAAIRSELVELAELLTRLEQRLARVEPPPHAAPVEDGADRPGLRLATEDATDVVGD